ncbi:hypothetical protein BC828DRAFT_405636 [Blastocladiella britannica]|nr:hypothetical protein BC828DRAFT_405636 [Blastocladiella britannica]
MAALELQPPPAELETSAMAELPEYNEVPVPEQEDDVVPELRNTSCPSTVPTADDGSPVLVPEASAVTPTSVTADQPSPSPSRSRQASTSASKRRPSSIQGRRTSTLRRPSAIARQPPQHPDKYSRMATASARLMAGHSVVEGHEIVRRGNWAPTDAGADAHESVHQWRVRSRPDPPGPGSYTLPDLFSTAIARATSSPATASFRATTPRLPGTVLGSTSRDLGPGRYTADMAQLIDSTVHLTRLTIGCNRSDIGGSGSTSASWPWTHEVQQRLSRVLGPSSGSEQVNASGAQTPAAVLSLGVASRRRPQSGRPGAGGKQSFATPHSSLSLSSTLARRGQPVAVKASSPPPSRPTEKHPVPKAAISAAGSAPPTRERSLNSMYAMAGLVAAVPSKRRKRQQQQESETVEVTATRPRTVAAMVVVPP